MGILQFVDSLAGALAWPGAVIAMAIVFRRPIVKVLESGTVKRLKAGPQGIELEFIDEKLQDARSDLTKAGAPELPQVPTFSSPYPDSQTTDFLGEMNQLAEVAPSAVVLESFSRLERVLRDAVDTDEIDGLSPSRPASVRVLARKALKQRIISAAEFSAFDDLAAVRNVVAHRGDDSLDKDRALSYAGLVQQFIISIALETGRTIQDGPIV
jgi:hypothetical protein